MITPLVSFDSEFNRVGFGKGFYDRFIAKSRQNVFPFITVGIAYNCQMWSETIASDKYDEKLDIIITENKVYFNEDSDIVQKIFSSANSTRILQEPILN